MITIFKPLVTPFLIGSATLAGRRWGPVVNGQVVGLPLTIRPISLTLALQIGLDFAVRAAAGNLAGQISIVVFCLIYSWAAQRVSWHVAVPTALLAFIAMTATLNLLSWQLWPGFLALLLAILGAARFTPQPGPSVGASDPPRWDIPARIVVATTFVFVLTTTADSLGPQLSGLVAPFPIFGVVFAAFTHAQQGPRAAAGLLRGIVLGSVSYACFFLVVGWLLMTLVALTASYLVYVSTRRRQNRVRPVG